MLLPVLYPDIIDQILSCFNLHDGNERNELSNCALVCKEWCQISRRLLFKNIDDISVWELDILRDLLGNHPGAHPLPSNKSTFAQYVRSAYSMICLDWDETWTHAKELFLLLKDYFPPDFQFSLLLSGKSLTLQHLSDIQSYIPNLVHLGLVVVEMHLSINEIRKFLGDGALPRLKRLSVCASGWKSKRLEIMATGFDDGAACSTLSLDNLLFQELQPFDMGTRFWPHEVFLNLKVKTVIIQAKVHNTSFWETVPAMLDKVSSSLVGLDVSYDLDYSSFTRGIEGIHFPKLQTIVLKMKHRTAPGVHPVRQTEGEIALQHLLSHMDTPIISTIFIIIPDAHEYILPGNGVPEWDGYEPLQWNIIDNTLSGLSPPEDPETTVSSSSRRTYPRPDHDAHRCLSRIIIGAWDYDWSMTSVSTEDATLYLQEHLPKCATQGVKISFKIVDDDLEFLSV